MPQAAVGNKMAVKEIETKFPSFFTLAHAPSDSSQNSTDVCHDPSTLAPSRIEEIPSFDTVPVTCVTVSPER